MKSRTVRQVLLAGAAAVVLGGGTVGYALAQQGPTGTPGARGAGQSAPDRARGEAYLQALASKLGVTVERLRQAMTDARSEAGPADRGERGPGGPRPMGRDGQGALGIAFDVAAQSVGITVEQLRTELPGKSLADVARAHGKNPADVATALKNAANQKLDQAVANGRLTAERATDMKAKLAEHLDALMNRTVPTGLGARGRGQGDDQRPRTSAAPGVSGAARSF